MRKTLQIGKAFLPCNSSPAWLWPLALLLFLASAIASSAAVSDVSETKLKAAYLFNIAKFVEWPAEAFSSETSPILIGVFGEEEFTTELRALFVDKKAHGRPFVVKRITAPQEAKSCQIVFISSSENKRVPQILEATKKAPALTIGESEQFLDAGGMINFLFEDAQLRFEVNTDAAEKAKLVISSKLLRLAKKRSQK
jgi:hypothetical protein